jgi:HEAT repeat protein
MILSGDIKAKIIESTALTVIIESLKDPNWGVRSAAIRAVVSLVSHGPNLL